MKKYSKYHFPILLLLMAGGLVNVSCADEDLSNNANGRNGVSFAVSDVQDAPDADLPTLTKSKEAYLTRSIDFNEAGTSDMCLEESTIPGVNPMKRTPQTRAWLKSTIDNYFGAFACPNGSPNPSYFDNEPVSPSGQMLQPKSWGSTASTLKFYAVYPYMNGTNAQQKLVYPTTGSLPYVAFEASTNIANQTDLMTAETAPISYTPSGAPHVVPLKFYHALTAIRFGIGSNLSWNKTIKSIEFQGIYKAGHFDLATKAWSHQSGAQTFKLDNIYKSTTGTPNTVIVKDGNTFLMVPQTLPSGAKIVVTFTDNSHITANIGGKTWAPGTTKTYMMTEKNSNWDYKLETTSPADIPHDQAQSDPYTIKSYRQSPGGVKQEAVAWKVIGYDADNNGTFAMNEKPAWLTSLTSESGTGGTAAESGTATVKVETVIDYLASRLAALKLDPKGTAGNYYDLSTHSVKGTVTPRNTANCYVISHPGFYKLPLVYGNAITGGNTNEHSYKTSETGTYVLSNFKDHNNQDITDPWIEKTNGGANSGIDGAKIVWSDKPNLVHNPAVVRDASGDAYLQFEVKAADIKCGNAVVAATKGGTVVWSWHLWFTADEVLDPVRVTNAQGVKYDFTKETVGWIFTEWKSTPYTMPRTVKVKVRQTAKNGTNYKESVITITQKSYSAKHGNVVMYQWGRKDPFPGINTLAQGSIGYSAAYGQPLHSAIQNPHILFNDKVYYTTYTNGDWCTTPYDNLWSADNKVYGLNDNPVVKTIYDPSPAGFKMPAGNAISSFGVSNISGGWDLGWNFWTNSNKNATIYFPPTGFRDIHIPRNHGVQWEELHGYYWTAATLNWDRGYMFSISAIGYGPSYTAYNSNRAFLAGLRPVADQ